MNEWSPKLKHKTKVIYKGPTDGFWYKSIIENANKLLEVGKEYTISEIGLNSSWTSVILEEFPNHKFSLSFFDYTE
jgi:hypothetical protein